jgi:hypothetical protein
MYSAALAALGFLSKNIEQGMSDLLEPTWGDADDCNLNEQEPQRFTK